MVGSEIGDQHRELLAGARLRQSILQHCGQRQGDRREVAYVLAAALTGTMAGCTQSFDYDHPIREPNYGNVRPHGYTPPRSSSSYSSSDRNTSKWDYYRN